MRVGHSLVDAGPRVAPGETERGHITLHVCVQAYLHYMCCLHACMHNYICIFNYVPVDAHRIICPCVIIIIINVIMH